MKKILFILLVPTILFAQKNNFIKDIKYKPYLDTLNSWDFKNELINLSSMDSVTLKTFNDLNKYRKSLGLGKLKYNPILSLACKVQSKYCELVLVDDISHENYAFENIYYPYRIKLVEYKTNINSNISPSGEIMVGTSSLTPKSFINITNNNILNLFISSKGHHEQMIDKENTHVGIYINESGDNCVIVFGIKERKSLFYNINNKFTSINNYESREDFKAHKIYVSILKYYEFISGNKATEVPQNIINECYYEILNKNDLKGKKCLIIIPLNDKLNLSKLYHYMTTYRIRQMFTNKSNSNKKRYLVVWSTNHS